MLVGRRAEHARIAELLAGAREGRSGALLLRGDPGIGKTALLEQAASMAAGMTVVHALGVEAEAEIEFSGLHELFRPLLGLLEAIPARQAQALRGALGLADSEAADRFTVGAATLSLLSAAAEQSPLLVLVDDAHWLDRPSQDALLFAARRLQSDRTALLFAAREGELPPFRAEAVETIVLAGLAPEESSALIELDAGGAVDAAVAAQLHEATGGNPLAVRELAPRLSGAERAGEEPLPRPLPVGPAVERAYLRRAEGLPETTRTGLLVAAAATTDRLGPIMQAIRLMGEEVRLEPAEDAGLILLAEGRVRFRHPLVRSALHGAMAASEARAVNGALAEALAGRPTPSCEPGTWPPPRSAPTRRRRRRWWRSPRSRAGARVRRRRHRVRASRAAQPLSRAAAVAAARGRRRRLARRGGRARIGACRGGPGRMRRGGAEGRGAAVARLESSTSPAIPRCPRRRCSPLRGRSARSTRRPPSPPPPTRSMPRSRPLRRR